MPFYAFQPHSGLVSPSQKKARNKKLKSAESLTEVQLSRDVTRLRYFHSMVEAQIWFQFSLEKKSMWSHFIFEEEVNLYYRAESIQVNLTGRIYI